MTSPPEGDATAHLVPLALAVAVGTCSLVVLNLLADDPHWALVPPGALLLGIVWFLAADVFRRAVRARYLREGSMSSRRGVLVAEVAVAAIVLALLMALTGVGTWNDQFVAALVGTTASFVADRLVVAPLVTRDAQR